MRCRYCQRRIVKAIVGWRHDDWNPPPKMHIARPK